MRLRSTRRKSPASCAKERSYYIPLPCLWRLSLRLNNDATRTEETTVEIGKQSFRKRRKESAHQPPAATQEEPLEPAFDSIAGTTAA